MFPIPMTINHSVMGHHEAKIGPAYLAFWGNYIQDTHARVVYRTVV